MFKLNDFLFLTFGVFFLLGGCKPSDFKIAAPSASTSDASSSGASFSHDNFLNAKCSQCHESLRPLNHTVNPSNPSMATSDCKQCHTSTTAWANSSHTHAATDTNCIGCHNGTTATGKASNHTLSGQCSACHVQTSWTHSYNTNYVHTNKIIPLSNGNSHPNVSQCVTCHNATSDSVNWLYTTTSTQSKVIPKGTCAGCHQDKYNSHHGTLTSTTSANCLSCHHTGYNDL